MFQYYVKSIIDSMPLQEIPDLEIFISWQQEH